MNGLDWTLTAIVLLFAGIGALRGLIAEVLSFVAWISAAVLAWLFYDGVAVWFMEHIAEPLLRQIAAFVAIFVVAFALLSALSFILRRFYFAASLTTGMRGLGALLGAVRGIVVVTVVVLLAGLTRFPQEPQWRASILAPHVESLATDVVQYFPGEVARQFRYQ